MSNLRAARLRLARRVLASAATLPVEERVQLFEDVATILPADEAKVARGTAWTLREAMNQQQTFLEILLK